MPGLEICCSFEFFPGGHTLPSTFDFSTMNFSHLNGNQFLIQHEASESGLRFDDEGMLTTLAFPTNTLRLRSGTFAGPCRVECKNISGDVVAAQTISTNNVILDHLLVGAGIRTVRFDGGSNEAMVVKVCAEYSCD